MDVSRNDNCEVLYCINSHKTVTFLSYFRYLKSITLESTSLNMQLNYFYALFPTSSAGQVGGIPFTQFQFLYCRLQESRMKCIKSFCSCCTCGMSHSL